MVFNGFSLPQAQAQETKAWTSAFLNYALMFICIFLLCKRFKFSNCAEEIFPAKQENIIQRKTSTVFYATYCALACAARSNSHLHNEKKTYRMLIALLFANYSAWHDFYPICECSQGEGKRLRESIQGDYFHLRLTTWLVSCAQAVIHGALCWCYFDVISCLIKFPRLRPVRCNDRQHFDGMCFSKHIIFTWKYFENLLIKISVCCWLDSSLEIGTRSINFHLASLGWTKRLCEINR